MTPTNNNNELDALQRKIWARINDEINLRNIKISIGDAYSLGSVIKEVLHPEVHHYAQKMVVAELKGIPGATLSDGRAKYIGDRITTIEREIEK